MGLQDKETLMLFLNILLAISGFLTVFLLQAIWRSQQKQADVLNAVVTKQAVHEIEIRNLGQRCHDCPNR